MSYGARARIPCPQLDSVFDIIYNKQNRDDQPTFRELHYLSNTGGNGWGSPVAPLFRSPQRPPLCSDGTVLRSGATKLALRSGSCPPLVAGEYTPRRFHQTEDRPQSSSPQAPRWASAGLGARAYKGLPLNWWKRNGGGRVDTLSIPTLPSDATAVLPACSQTRTPPHHSSQHGTHTPAHQRRPDAELLPTLGVQGLGAGDQHFSTVPLRKANSCLTLSKTTNSPAPSVRKPIAQADTCSPMVSPVRATPSLSFGRPVATPFSGQRPGSRGVQPLRTTLRTPLVGPSKAVEGGIVQSRGYTWLTTPTNNNKYF